MLSLLFTEEATKAQRLSNLFKVMQLVAVSQTQAIGLQSPASDHWTNCTWGKLSSWQATLECPPLFYSTETVSPSVQ